MYNFENNFKIIQKKLSINSRKVYISEYKLKARLSERNEAEAVFKD